jgi:hypothetical protein
VLQVADLPVLTILVLLLAIVLGRVLPKGPGALLVHPVTSTERWFVIGVSPVVPSLQLFVIDRVVIVGAFCLDIVDLIEEIDHRLDGVLNASAVLLGDLQPPPARR